jgi:MFS family permease
VAGADIRRFSSDQRGQTRSFISGVVSASLAALADALLVPMLLLSVFVAELTDSYILVGLVPAIAVSLYFLPTAIVANSLRGRRKLPWLLGASLVRAAALALLAYIVSQADRLTDRQILQSFFICFATYTLASGFATTLSTDIAARAVARNHRGGFFSQRNLISGAVATIAALVVIGQFSAEGPAFPMNYGVLFITATVALVMGLFFETRLTEPSRPVRRPPLVRTGFPIAAARYRRFLIYRAALSSVAIADPFYIVFALRSLGIEPIAIGWYLLTMLAARVVTQPLWVAYTRTHGARNTLQAAALPRLLMPLIALLMPFLIDTGLYRDRLADTRFLPISYGVIFLLAGVALAAQAVGNWTYLVEIAPSGRRGTYVRPTNVVLAIVGIVPLAGGWLIERYDFEALFIATTGIALVTLTLSGGLSESVGRVRPVANAWRVRRARG